MKYKGRKISEPNREYVVIPRPEYVEEDAEGNLITKNGDVVFVCEAVPNFDEFEAKVPAPAAPLKLVPGGEKVENLEDKSYLQRTEDYGQMKMDWMLFRSLSATPGLEWDTVKEDDPKTWSNIQQELKDANFTEIEVGMILRGMMDANSLNEDKLDAARDRFLLERLQ